MDLSTHKACQTQLFETSMNEELQQKLFSEFPLLFRQKDLPKNETAMCWGICIKDGWFQLLNSLCIQIEKHYSQLE